VSQSLTRTFPIASHPDALLRLAGQPLLASAYLNFLDTIAPVDARGESDGWKAYDVQVSYRSLLKASGRVEHLTEPHKGKSHLRHDGPLARFEAVFSINHGRVDLTCTYEAKAAMINWLVAKVLDRTLKQVAAAMDRYAATRSIGPT
jgi:hypothetical protein